MATPTDSDGQPLNLHFNASRRLERDISEMLGLAKGLLADGVVTQEEADLLQQWLGAHPESRRTWPANILAARVERAFADGQVTPDERKDLADLLSDLVGGKTRISAGDNAATELPLDRPSPTILFQANTFVLTGKFAFGPRTACEETVRAAGGQCESAVTRRTSYLVIGTFGSRDWVQTSHGRKIEKAVQYRAAGQRLFIVGEEHWAASLPGSSA